MRGGFFGAGFGDEGDRVATRDVSGLWTSESPLDDRKRTNKTSE